MNLPHAPLALALLLGCSAPAAFADPLPPRFLQNAEGQSALWNGIGQLQTPTSGCTATLIDSRSPEHPGTPAYLLTAGHCINQAAATVTRDQPIEGSVTFNYFSDTVEQRTRVALREVKWAAMHGADLAIIELDSTLDSLIEGGINPMNLATQPEDGAEMLVLGIAGDDTLQWSACTAHWAGTVVEVPWVWRHQVKNACAGVRSGMSGGAFIDPTGNGLFAVTGTTTFGSTAQDRRGAPFEINNGQAQWTDSTNYGSTVDHLQACFSEGRFKRDARGCALEPAFSLLPDTGQPPVAALKLALDAGGQAVAPSWGYRFGLDTPAYRYKAVRDPQSCENPQHYSHAISAQDAVIDDPLPAVPGMHFLCITGVDSADQVSWPGLLRNSVSHGVRLHEAGPTKMPRVGMEWTEDGQLFVSLRLEAPHLTGLRLKRGLPDETDCEDPAGYTEFATPIAFIRALQDPPLRLCSYGTDSNGQLSALQVTTIPPS